MKADITPLVFLDFDGDNATMRRRRKAQVSAVWGLEDEVFHWLFKYRYEGHKFYVFMQPGLGILRANYSWHISKPWHLAIQTDVSATSPPLIS